MIIYNLGRKNGDVYMLKRMLYFKTIARIKSFILLCSAMEIHTFILSVIAAPVFKITDISGGKIDSNLKTIK